MTQTGDVTASVEPRPTAVGWVQGPHYRLKQQAVLDELGIRGRGVYGCMIHKDYESHGMGGGDKRAQRIGEERKGMRR